MSPLREGWVTGSATAIGAFIPVLPFLLFGGTTAVVIAFVISMLGGAGVALLIGAGIIAVDERRGGS